MTTKTMKSFKLHSEDGVTEIITAEDLASAIQQAEEWIRDGEWGDDGAVVSCSIQELLPITIEYYMGDTLVGTYTTADPSTDDEISEWESWMEDNQQPHDAPDNWDAEKNGEWDDTRWDGYIVRANESDDEEEVEVEIEPNHAAKIREAAGDADICGTDPDDHDWTSDGEGGLKENPGVWSRGGTAMTFDAHCRKCGLHRHERTTGSQRNPDDHDTVEYEMLDDDTIATHRANGDMD